MSDLAFDSSRLFAFTSSRLFARNETIANVSTFQQVIIRIVPNQLGNPSLFLSQNPGLLDLLFTTLESLPFPSVVPSYAYTGSQYQLRWTNNPIGEISSYRFELETDGLLGVDQSIGHYTETEPPVEWAWVKSYLNFRRFDNRLVGLEMAKSRMTLQYSKFPACISSQINGVKSCLNSRLIAPDSGLRWSHDGDVINLKAPLITNWDGIPTFGGNSVWSEYLRADVRISSASVDPIPACCNIAP